MPGVMDAPPPSAAPRPMPAGLAPGGATMAGPRTSNASAPHPALPASGVGAQPQQTLGSDPGLAPAVNYFQSADAAAVQGYGDIAAQDFTKQVGQMLGNLNSIGALRSGGVEAGINDAMTKYGRQIGDYASMTATTAAGQGQEENAAQIERNFRQQQLDAANRNSVFGDIGQLLGAGLGFASKFVKPGS